MAKTNEEVAKEFGFAAVIVLGALIIFPLFVFSVPFLVLVRVVNRPKVQGVIGTLSLLTFIGLMVLYPTHYFALYSVLPISTGWLETLIGEPLRFHTTSYLLYATGGIFFAYVTNLAVNYHRSKKVTTKEGERDAFLQSPRYRKVRKNRYQLAAKAQQKWRQRPDGKLLLGIDEKGKPYAIDFKELNQHHLVVATTGGGKTIYLLSAVEYALMHHYPIVFIDGKGSSQSIEEVRTLCDRYGRELKVFSDTGKLTYNPLKYGNATTIKDKLEQLIETESKYYTEISTSLVQALIQFIDEYEFPRDLWTFARFLDPEAIKQVLNQDTVPVEEDETGDAEGYASFLDDAEEAVATQTKPKKKKVKTVRSPRAERFYHQFFERYRHTEEGEKYLFQNASSVRTQIYLLLDSELGHLFKEQADGLDLVQLSENKEALFISLDGLIYDKFLKVVSRFIILDLNYLVSYRNRGQKQDEPLLAIYDEFSAYANDKIVDTINKSRSAGFHCIIATQTLSDLDKVGRNLANQIVGNTNTYAFGQTNDPQGVQYMVDTLGTYKDLDATIQTERQAGRLKRVDLKAEKGTIRRVQKYKVSPDEIRDLRQGSFVIYRKAAKESLEPAIIYARNPLVFD